MRISSGYVPRILLCGDEESFRQAAAGMEIDIVGKISFFGSPERGENYIFTKFEDAFAFVPKELKIFLDGKEISADELRKLLDGTADYIVFDSKGEYIGRNNDMIFLRIFERFIHRETLFRQARHNFCSHENYRKLAALIREQNFSHVLDFDAYLYETDFFMFNEPFPTTDALAKNLDRSNVIAENFYDRIYDTFADCRFKHYDAILLAERAPEEFIDVLLETNDAAENILTFARKNSPQEKFLSDNGDIFEKISAYPAVNGNWYLLKKCAPKDFCV